ncbi:MAG: N-6 DNA methylase, partial [Sediminibacterium sp.]|nr:N-6 DNA methylase [Sediminibacterium sp.]
MASLVKNYSIQKTLGQIYTPFFIVEKILNDIGFNNTNILRKYVLDPACGDGRFLEEIVKRIIQFSEPENLKSNLLFVYGWDIDDNAISSCINN